jgi:beta-lactam-binding protein with PASTA domain
MSILLLTALAVGALNACGGSISTTSTSSVTSGSTTTGSATSPDSSPATSASGSGKEAIPRLAGDTVAIAELYLRQIGLHAGQTLNKPNTKYQSGLVITTSPYAGDVVVYGSAVDLLVSAGSPGCQVPSCSESPDIAIAMPYLIGQTIDQATTTLAMLGITLGSEVVEASSAPQGTVICTVPAAGESFLLTTPVDVGVSSGDPGSPPATLCSGVGASSGPPTSPTSTTPTSPASTPPTSPSSTPPQSPSSQAQPSATP